MPKGANQKLKLLYLMKIFIEKTDENHSITMSEILTSLESYGIQAERKSIYDDIEALKVFGLDIVGQNVNRTYSYQLVSREFELPELKLLVDAVQSSKYMTLKKSNELIGKIETLASKYDAMKLQRQVYVANRIKTMNESIFYNVDQIHTAISANKRIKFQYFQWTVDKEMKKKKDGAFYFASPWALTVDDENYYLIAYEDKQQSIRHYRVDKMLQIELCEELREGKELFEQFDTANYSKKMFGMYGGKEETIQIQFRNNMAGVVIDRFGKDISLQKVDTEHFKIHVNIAVSQLFFGWLISLGEDARLIGPENVLMQLKEEVRRLSRIYLS